MEHAAVWADVAKQQNLSAVKLLRCAGAEQLARISYLLQLKTTKTL